MCTATAKQGVFERDLTSVRVESQEAERAGAGARDELEVKRTGSWKTSSMRGPDGYPPSIVDIFLVGTLCSTCSAFLLGHMCVV
jgi:hypothetical protein